LPNCLAGFWKSWHKFVSRLIQLITLNKLFQDPHIPLLALLELDHYQVQSLFLERLRDPLEEENVKLAIIDLINTCISSQNGMTAAFFNLKCFMYWDGTENDVFSGDSVSDFMVDYLQNIKKVSESRSGCYILSRTNL
jgi:nuclear pore complex protein Nup188